mgnify:CR=1 FL=1
MKQSTVIAPSILSADFARLGETARGAFVLIGGIGALRLPGFYTRLHAASLTDTMAAILILGGIMLQAGLTLATIKLVAILLFLLLTSPTASNALASNRSGDAMWGN